MQQERHAIVAQRASPLRPTSRLKARHLFRGFQKNGYFGYFFISSYRMAYMSYIVWVYTVDKTPYVVTLSFSQHAAVHQPLPGGMCSLPPQHMWGAGRHEGTHITET